MKTKKAIVDHFSRCHDRDSSVRIDVDGKR